MPNGDADIMNGAIRCLAKELASKKIRVNAVMPGITRTAIFDQIMDNGGDSDDLKGILQRQYLGVCEPENIANTVAFLLSEEANYLTGSAMLAYWKVKGQVVPEPKSMGGVFGASYLYPVFLRLGVCRAA